MLLLWQKKHKRETLRDTLYIVFYKAFCETKKNQQYLHRFIQN